MLGFLCQHRDDIQWICCLKKQSEFYSLSPLFAMYHATKPNLFIPDKFLIDRSGSEAVFVALCLCDRCFIPRISEDSLRVRGSEVFGMHRYSLCVSAIFRGMEYRSQENLTSQCFHPKNIR